MAAPEAGIENLLAEPVRGDPVEAVKPRPRLISFPSASQNGLQALGSLAGSRYTPSWGGDGFWKRTPSNESSL